MRETASTNCYSAVRSVLLVRALVGGALARISNPALFIYSVGLMMAVFGLMAMCIAYIVRVLWHRLKDNRRGYIQRN